MSAKFEVPANVRRELGRLFLVHVAIADVRELERAAVMCESSQRILATERPTVPKPTMAILSLRPAAGADFGVFVPFTAGRLDLPALVGRGADTGRLPRLKISLRCCQC